MTPTSMTSLYMSKEIHNFLGIAQDKEDQKLTKSTISIGVVDMMNLFLFDISNRLGDTEK